MRRNFLILLLGAGVVSCENGGVPFHQGGEFSEAESQNLALMDPELPQLPPSDYAVWNRNGVFRHICLYSYEIPSVIDHVKVFVFNERGELLEANILNVSVINGVRNPKAVLSIDPLRLQFEVHTERDGKWTKSGTEMLTVGYSQEEARRKLREWCDLRRTLTKQTPDQ
jgi:hypothetical protein